MGRRGPAPTPTAVKLARGETRPSRLDYEEPTPRRRLPSMPKDIDPEARKVWRRILREMGETGVITAADADLLRAYCEAVASYVRNRRLMSESGAVVRGARGRDLVKSPLHQIVREERDAIRLLARELGLSPSARVGLRIDMSKPTESIEDVIGPPPRLRALGRQAPAAELPGPRHPRERGAKGAG